MTTGRRFVFVGALVGGVLVLGGCGADSCTTDSVAVVQVAPCTLRSGQAGTVEVTACQDGCSSNPSCDADVPDPTDGGQILLNVTVQQCDTSSCPAQSCTNGTVTCTVPALGAGTYQILTGDGVPRGTIVASAGGSDSCSF